MNSKLQLVPLIFLIFIVIAFAIAIAVRMKEVHRAPIAERRSADGKVVCFSDGRSMSCVPVWLLDKPNNWVVMYPHSAPTGKVRK